MFEKSRVAFPTWGSVGSATQGASSPPSPGCPTVEGSLSMPASLARRYDEAVQVDHRDNAPIAFVRRHRGYVIRAVLAHWWETGAWWEQPVDTGVADDERELWRVEAAAPGRSPVVVELAHSWSTGRWTLAAVLD